MQRRLKSRKTNDTTRCTGTDDIGGVLTPASDVTRTDCKQGREEEMLRRIIYILVLILLKSIVVPTRNGVITDSNY